MEDKLEALKLAGAQLGATFGVSGGDSGKITKEQLKEEGLEHIPANVSPDTLSKVLETQKRLKEKGIITE
jgi:hypothetical protein